MNGGLLSTPRPVPSRLVPAAAGTAVVVIALPLFVAAGWRIGAWGIAAGLWAAYQAVGFWLDRVPMGIDSVAAAGIVAFGRMTRAVVLVAVLIVVAVKDSGLGLPAAVVYGIAFSVEFGASLFAYVTGQASA